MRRLADELDGARTAAPEALSPRDHAKVLEWYADVMPARASEADAAIERALRYFRSEGRCSASWSDAVIANIESLENRDLARAGHPPLRSRTQSRRLRRQIAAVERGEDPNAEHVLREPDAEPEGGDDDTQRSVTAGGGRKATIADQLVELAADVQLMHTPAGIAYATVAVCDHLETHAVMGRGLRRWLARRYWDEHRGAPPADSLRQALAVLEAQAIYDGAEAAVHLRVARAPDGAVWLDLADSEWCAVRIDDAGWRVVDRPPIRFRRAAGMLAHPLPQRGGDLGELVDLLPGAEEEHARALLVGWAVAALRPEGPYPIAVIQGEQGAGKSTASRMLRRLVDPAQAELRSPPREIRDLSIAAGNAWVVGLDNLSGVPDWLSDALCRLATGGGFATRTLYSDDDETIIDATRPMIANGIDAVATRGDLLDRALLVTLPAREEYRREADVWARFEVARPRLLGALLNAVSLALRREGDVTVPPSLRLADAARWVAAAEPVLPIAPGAWIAAYAGVRAEGHAIALDAHPIGSALRSIAVAPGGWSGTAASLLVELGKRDPDGARRKEWPGNPRAVSAAVRRLAPALRGVGIVVEYAQQGRDRGRRRVIHLTAAQGDANDRPHRPHPPQSRADGANGADGVAGVDGVANPPASAAGAEEGVL